jgi:uncharacterized protein (DUF885 family)
MTIDPRVPISDNPLDVHVAAFVRDQLAAQPTDATLLGVAGYDHLLPDLSLEAIARRERADVVWSERFAALRSQTLTADELIDRDLVLSELRGRAVTRDWQRHLRDPEVYGAVGLAGVFGLLLHGPLPRQELADAMRGRLAAVPDVLATGRRQLEAELAAPILVRKAAAAARGGVLYLREVVPAMMPEVAAQVAVAATAYEQWADFLEILARDAEGGFAIGEGRYSGLLREKEGLGYGAAGLRERGLVAHAELVARIRERTHALVGHADWRGYMRELRGDAPGSPAEMLAGYQAATDRARAFAYRAGLISELEQERCVVLPAEEFQRTSTSLAFYVPSPPFASGERIGHFFVPYPPAGATPQDVSDRLAANNYSAMPTIAAHEAYPGHHWHLTHMAAENRRPLRTLLRTPYLTEGWAVYVEQAMAEAGFFTTPGAAFRQVEFRLFRAVRIVVDTALHTGEWSVDQAVEFMLNNTSLNAAVARTEVVRYCGWPTQAASSFAGAMEIARLRDSWLAGGRGDLRQFHDRLTATGGLPIALAERALGLADAPDTA